MPMTPALQDIVYACIGHSHNHRLLYQAANSHWGKLFTSSAHQLLQGYAGSRPRHEATCRALSVFHSRCRPVLPSPVKFSCCCVLGPLPKVESPN